MRKPFHPKREELRLSSVMHALSEPIRLNIVRTLLSVSTVDCAAIYPDMPKSTRSYHFRILREAGLTSTEVHSSSRRVSLREEDIEDLFPGLLDTIAHAKEPM